MLLSGQEYRYLETPFTSDSLEIVKLCKLEPAAHVRAGCVHKFSRTLFSPLRAQAATDQLSCHPTGSIPLPLPHPFSRGLASEHPLSAGVLG